MTDWAERRQQWGWRGSRTWSYIWTFWQALKGVELGRVEELDIARIIERSYTSPQAGDPHDEQPS